MCDCIKTINEKLAPEHMLNCTLDFKGGDGIPIVGLIRLDKWELEKRRGKPSSFFCNHCPWCGEKYAERVQ